MKWENLILFSNWVYFCFGFLVLHSFESFCGKCKVNFQEVLLAIFWLTLITLQQFLGCRNVKNSLIWSYENFFAQFKIIKFIVRPLWKSPKQCLHTQKLFYIKNFLWIKITRIIQNDFATPNKIYANKTLKKSLKRGRQLINSKLSFEFEKVIIHLNTFCHCCYLTAFLTEKLKIKRLTVEM